MPAGMGNARTLGARLPIPCPAPESAILPWILGDEARALVAARLLVDAGFLAPAIRYPTVPRRTARIRLAMSASHSIPEVEHLAEAIGHVAREVQGE